MCFLSDMDDNHRQIENDQRLRHLWQRLVLLIELSLELESLRSGLLSIERVLQLISGNENETFLCVLVLIFEEALHGITYL